MRLRAVSSRLPFGVVSSGHPRPFLAESRAELRRPPAGRRAMPAARPIQSVLGPSSDGRVEARALRCHQTVYDTSRQRARPGRPPTSALSMATRVSRARGVGARVHGLTSRAGCIIRGRRGRMFAFNVAACIRAGSPQPQPRAHLPVVVLLHAVRHVEHESDGRWC